MNLNDVMKFLRLTFAIVVFNVITAMAANAAQPVHGISVKISRIASHDFGQYVLLYLADGSPNTSGCGVPDQLLIPRNLAHFNEMFSLATASMLSGKTVVVWTGSPLYGSPCFGTIAQISRLDIVN